MSECSHFGVREAVNETIPAGTTDEAASCGLALVHTDDADGASEASRTSYFLNYQAPDGAPPPSIVKANSDRVEWPYTPNCWEVPFPK